VDPIGNTCTFACRYAINSPDANTVPQVLPDFVQRFGLGRIVFVRDHGMVTSQTSIDLRARGHGYMVGRNRRLRRAASG